MNHSAKAFKGRWETEDSYHMKKGRVRDGTPDHRINLCDTCQNARIVRGHAESQEHRYCSEVSFGRDDRIPWPVASCYAYRLRGQLTMYEMERMAYLIEIKEGKIGFRRLTDKEKSE